MIESLGKMSWTLAIVLVLSACGGDDTQTTGRPSLGAGGAPVTSGTTASGATVGSSGVGTTVGSSGVGTTVGSSGVGTSGGGTTGVSTTGVGTSGAGTGGAGGGVGTGGGGGLDVVGGYVNSGSWHGYAWTASAGVGSTIMPADFSRAITGQPLCVSGSVAPLADFSGVALLGVNLNQAMQGMPAPLTVVPTSDGITLTVTKTMDPPMRIQIQGPDGATDPNQRWCAPLTGSGGFIRWNTFNTKCWDGSGTFYANGPIVSASVLVPGGSMTAVPFGFCLTSIKEGA